MLFWKLISGHIGVQCTHRRDRRTPQGTAEKPARQVAKTGAQKTTAAAGRVQNTRRTTGPAQTDIRVLILKYVCSETIHKTYQICNLLLFVFYFYYFFFLLKGQNNLVCFFFFIIN